MSFEITASTTLPSRTIPPEPLKTDPARKQPGKQPADKTASNQPETAKSTDFFKAALSKLSAGHKHAEKHSLKTISHLMRSLQKVFGDAPKVDRETGAEEMRHGGMRRVGNDLRKLFRGLGIPPQMAKEFAHGMTDALQNQETEQINFSLTATRSVNLNIQQLQSGYQASGDGSSIAAATANSFQLSAVQARSIDISINLRTGEFSLTRTSTDTLSISGARATAQAGAATQAMAGSEPALPTETAPQTAEGTTTGSDFSATEVPEATAESQASDTAAPTAESQPAPVDDFAALVQSNGFLLQISRTIQQSAMMQLKPAGGSGTDEAKAIDEDKPSGGLRVLQDMIARLQELSGAAHDLFDTLVQVNNLRVENQDGDDHLRFTIDALAPVGLTAVDKDGRGATVYPRPDGSLAKVVEEPVTATA